MGQRILDEDVVRVWGERRDRWTSKTKQNQLVEVFYWGDEVDLIDPSQNDATGRRDVQVRYYDYGRGRHEDGVIRKRKVRGKYRALRFRTDRLLEVTFVDVQQGDAAFVRTPDGKFMVVDGGEGPFLARLLASENPGSTAAKPFVIDVLVITHGDADHFKGLVALADAATETRSRKRIHAKVLRYYHSGLVKGPGGLPAAEVFGAHRKVGTITYATDLHDDPREAATANRPFAAWFGALVKLTADADAVAGTDRVAGERFPVLKRLEFGDHAAFDVFRPEVDVQVLGPVAETVNGSPALPFLRDPAGHISASHTINGHSVVLRLSHGNVSFLLGGDLNIDAERRLREAVDADPSLTLRSEILKVPHHGSHEFEPEFLAAVNPVVSIVSSGDENARKEYVHPRASLMAALGRASRGPEPLLFSTELSAFFAYRGGVVPERHKDNSGTPLAKSKRKPFFFAHERLVFGAVRVRTDGHRVLCAVESANARIKEAYAFTVDAGANILSDEWSLI
jgi:glyoxylase-like metal-dependent hydrolase (beta-lactamase superfamily II)